jgi:ubiquitin-protein ligase
MSSSNRVRRVSKELGDIKKDTASRILCEAVGSDLSHLQASFPGPPDTPYEGGTFFVDIQIPQEYPFRPPQMKFKTRLWHPNISSQTVYISSLGRNQISDKIIGSNLSRYVRHSLVSGSNHQICSAVSPISA